MRRTAVVSHIPANACIVFTALHLPLQVLAKYAMTAIGRGTLTEGADLLARRFSNYSKTSMQATGERSTHMCSALSLYSMRAHALQE